MKKVFSLILGMLGLTLLLFTCNLNVNAVAANTIVKDGKTFEKVTSQAQVTEGNYIIGADGKETFAGNLKKDYYQSVSEVKDAVVFTFEKAPNGYFVKNTVNNKYVSSTSAKKMVEVDLANADDVLVTETCGLKFKSAELRYNSSSPRFSTYKSGQQPIELFKEQSNAPELTEYIVTLNTMGGNELAPITGYEGKTLTNLPVPVKPGFKFAGWYKEEGLVNIWNEETDVVTANMTLYAKWEESNLVQVTSVEELVSAKYIVKANNLYLGSYSKKFLTTGNENEATELTIQKLGNGYKISFDDNGETKYITTTVTGSTDIHTTLNKMDAYVSTIELAKEGNNLFTVNLGSNRRLALNNDKIGAYLVDNSQYSPVELYKVKGSEMADEVAFVEEFVQTKTLSSLKMTYDVETTTAIDVDLRFGTVLKASAYDASAKYGVLLVKKEAGINFANGKQTEATALEFVNNHAGVKSLEATNIARVDDNGVESETGNNYQFAWVVTNMEEVGYATELVAVTYVEYDGALYFANQTSYSVKSLCQKYINDNVSEVVNNATVKAVFENIIKG